MQTTDVAIIGGGIVGLATGYRITERFPGTKVVILEKEAGLAHHQTGHNSGVLHSGVYYRPGSLKALNCRRGKEAMEAFCEAQDIDYEICGKVIVAVEEWELPILERIESRGQENGVRCEMIDKERLRELEPHTAGIQALHVPEAGIVDYKQVCQRLAQLIEQRDGQIVVNARVTAMRHNPKEAVLEHSSGELSARWVVNCSGLHCDRMTRLSGQSPEAQIVPFRGEYYQLKPHAFHLVRSLIYPVPDPGFPFLGVHFTKMIDGRRECGPNAVLALAREGYTKTTINIRDLAESITYPGFLRMAARYWRTGLAEMWRSVSKRAFLKALQRLVPDVRSDDLESAPAGVRAQAIRRDGVMVDDFVIQYNRRVINVGNAPSPAATASLNVGNLIVDRLAENW